MSNQFDVSKPVFDLFALRSIRGDAVLQYDSVNQSEPLRINLYGLLALTLLALPLISEAVGGEPVGLTGTIGSILGSLVSGGLFVRECQNRSKQLTRMEKELNAEDLQICIPSNVLSDRLFGKPQSLKMLKKSSVAPPRIIALCGPSIHLQQNLKTLAVLGRRLRQASTFVVAIPVDGSTRLEWGVGKNQLPWLAEPFDLQSWIDYFDDLAAVDDNANQCRWLGLNSNGRSFISGKGNGPQWLEVLGQHLRPTELLDEDDPNVEYNRDNDVATEVLEAQKLFYNALTTGDLNAMIATYTSATSAQVSEVIAAGGRIDDWKACLADGARPEGMRVSGGDATVVSDCEAYSTVIEFPQNTGIDTATLLAVQKWTRASASDPWKLELHQTIPWSADTRAQGTLRCDCRGCVALTRSAERRTFGGIIG